MSRRPGCSAIRRWSTTWKRSTGCAISWRRAPAAALVRVAGRLKKPGGPLGPAGLPGRELIDEHCGGMLRGHKFYAYLPGGASGGILPASLGNIPHDFDTLQPYDCF